jgi:hypothetical protein
VAGEDGVNAMSTWHVGYVVSLAKDLTEEESEAVINAIGLIKGVIAVEPVQDDRAEMMIERQRVRQELRRRIFAVLDKGFS